MERSTRKQYTAGYRNWYEYDALHRLVRSYGDNVPGHYDYTMEYTSSGRIMKKYRSTPPVTVSTPVVNMYYGYCEASMPHAVRRIFDEQNGMRFDFRWDASGNLGQISTGNLACQFETGRFLFWTEDSRMHAVADDKYYSYYAYDHGGERRLKLTGNNNVININADFIHTVSLLKTPTIYPSAYMVLSNRGYTKHYYAGSERVATRIGGGGLYAAGVDPELSGRSGKVFCQSLDQVNSRRLKENKSDCIAKGLCTHGELLCDMMDIPSRLQADTAIDYTDFRRMIHDMRAIHHDEPDVYFYHSDHLGSASWITDNGGVAVQHLQYLPYGERYVDQRVTGYQERFTFTGKERDEETGYGYFGARYMDHELTTMWLSVDPMSDKYPGISPYAYCAWNPVKLVDPDGREIYYKEGRAYFIYKKNAEGEYGFYNCSTGEVYSGENKKYVDDLTKALGQLKEGKHGNKLVSYFEGHQDRPIFIHEEEKNNQNGTNINWDNTDKIQLPVGATLSDPVQIESTEPFVCLGHEMVHARDAYKFGDKFNTMSRKVKEQSAMLTENFIRREHGFRQRTFYGLKGERRSVDYDSYPALVLPLFPVKVNPRNNAPNNFLFDF